MIIVNSLFNVDRLTLRKSCLSKLKIVLQTIASNFMLSDRAGFPKIYPDSCKDDYLGRLYLGVFTPKKSADREERLPFLNAGNCYLIHCLRSLR